MRRSTIRFPRGAYCCRELWFEENNGKCSLRAKLNSSPESVGDFIAPIFLSGSIIYFLFKDIGLFKGQRVYEATEQCHGKEDEEGLEKLENLHLLIGPYPGLWPKDA